MGSRVVRTGLWHSTLITPAMRGVQNSPDIFLSASCNVIQLGDGFGGGGNICCAPSAVFHSLRFPVGCEMLCAVKNYSHHFILS